MFKEVSWSVFLFYLGLSLGIYYLIAGFYFYGKEIKSWREKNKNNQGKGRPLQTKGKAEVPLGGSYDYGEDF